MAKQEIVNLGKLADVDLGSIPRVEDCNPGIEPVEFNVILILAPPPKVAGRNATILLPDGVAERMSNAAQVARIIAQSPIAYSYEAWPEGSRKPRPGDVVWFPRYAGGLFTGLDGREYRIVKDKDIAGIVSRVEDQ